MMDSSPLAARQGSLANTFALLRATPHRAYFAAGILASVLLALWWTLRISVPLVGTRPALMVHGMLMLLGVFPLFMFGFIFTAGPRWLASSAPHAPLPLAAGYLAGLLLALAGFELDDALALTGLALMQLVWLRVLMVWAGCIRRARNPDRLHACAVLGSFVAGTVGLGCALLWVAGNDARWWFAARALLLWGWLLPTFLTVCHRMLPFFTQSALPAHRPWRPVPLLCFWLGGCAALTLGALLGWPWLQAGAAFALAASCLWTSWRWGLLASLSVRLLAMLHLGFAWLGIALILQGCAALGAPLGSAPVHALALGFCGSLLFGFVSRVSLGHSGRPLQADDGLWWLYLGFHAVAALRVAAALLQLALPWLDAIAGLWLLLLLAWGLRLAPMHLYPRSDGQPG